MRGRPDWLYAGQHLPRGVCTPAPSWLLAALLVLPGLARAVSAPGPDAFGYTVAPTTNFTFLQITNGGTRTLYFDDDTALTANIGFTFNFYGTNYNSVSFNPNGLMTFSGTSTDYFNVNLTTT